MTDFNYHSKSTTLEKLVKLLSFSNKNNESLPEVDKKYSFQLDNKTFVEFSKYDWEILNKLIFEGQELSNSREETIMFFLETIEEDENGFIYNYCFNFTINNLHSLAKTQKRLHKISQEIDKAEKYLNEAYNLFYNPSTINNLSACEFRELAILTLSRIYDDDKQSVSLPNILNCIMTDFDKWLKMPHSKLEKKNLDEKMLLSDLEKISDKSNKIVQKLFKQRNKSIAHLDEAYVFRLFKSCKEPNWGFPVHSELVELITIAKELRDRYSTAINI
ncbi:hypothetical protein QUB75_10625 [Microcoleus sp. K1-B6]|uniref:AbiU2 domain-containing protein n=1 Tax=unclassified Microcoleus TaxID=2642155 RepID=UPI002FD30F56